MARGDDSECRSTRSGKLLKWNNGFKNIVKRHSGVFAFSQHGSNFRRDAIRNRDSKLASDELTRKVSWFLNAHTLCIQILLILRRLDARSVSGNDPVSYTNKSIVNQMSRTHRIYVRRTYSNQNHSWSRELGKTEWTEDFFFKLCLNECVHIISITAFLFHPTE